MADSQAAEFIRSACEKKQFPDGTEYSSISLPSVGEIAARFDLPPKIIEITALENGIVPERYARNFKAFSIADQIVLLKACVGVVGLGGLGGFVTEILARMGVGRLVLFDGDVFDVHNLNRQLFSTEQTIGCAKAKAAAHRVKAVNSSVEVVCHPMFLDEENARNLLTSVHLIVDCLDNLPTRFVLERTAKEIGIPLVSAAVAGASGQITTIFPEDAGLRGVFGNPEDLPVKGAETTLGCLPHAVSLIASLECAEVAKALLKQKGLLRNKLLVVDLEENRFDVFTLKAEE